MPRTASSLRRGLAGTVAALALVHAVLLTGLPGMADLAWWTAGAVLGFALMPPRLGLLLSGSILAATLLLSGLVAWAGPLTGLEAALFPNPVTRLIRFDFWRGRQIFQPRTDAELVIPCGDLAAMTTSDAPRQEKRVRFRTDSLGYRNEADFAGQAFALLGDSFVVASSTDQADIPSAQLARLGGPQAYNLAAVGGDMADYARWTRDFKARHPGSARLILFCFEGNDFDPVTDRDRNEPAWRLWLRRYRDWYRFLPLGRTVFTQFARLRAAHKDDPVVVKTIGGRPMAFYRPYVDQVRRPRPRDLKEFPNLLAEMAPDVAAVFFIPAKYRVYSWLLDQPETNLPDAQWEYLAGQCNSLGLACRDLTPSLTAEAETALAQGEFVYFADDTHWNARGIAAAAREIAQTMAQTMARAPEKGQGQ